MNAMARWMRADLRRNWVGLLVVTIAVALSLGFALTAAVAARRTSHAWTRFLHGTDSAAVFTEVPIGDVAPELARVQAMTGAADTTAFTFMGLSYEGFQPAAGGPTTFGGFTGIAPGFLDTIYRPYVVAGRLPDPARADEISISESAAALTGLRSGDHIVLTSQPEVVHQDATVVGIQRGAFDLANNTSPQFLLTPAFGARWLQPYLAAMPTDVRQGLSGVVVTRPTDPVLRAQLLTNGYISTDVLGTEVTGGLNAQSTGLVVLAAVAAVGALAATGQAISRRVRRRAAELPVLSALGLSPTGRRVAVAASAVGAATTGALLAPMVAYLASPLAITGLERRLLVHPHLALDVTIAATMVVAAVAVFLLVGGLSAARIDRRQRVAADPHPSPLTLPGPSGLFGGRAAAGWAQRSGRVTARAHVIGLALALALTTGVALWVTSAHHLTATPAAYGQDFDAVITPSDASTSPSDAEAALDSAIASLGADPQVGMVLGRLDAGMVGDEPERVEVLEVDQEAGAWWPTLIAGRVPESRDEVTIGSALLHNEHLHLGETTSLGGRTFTIVGEHVAPQFSNGQFGESIAVPAAHADLPIQLGTPYLLVQLARGATVDDLGTLAGPDLRAADGPGGEAGVAPGPIANLGRLGAIDTVLLLVCTLLALAEFANGLLLATRARRRDHATLQALGGSRRTVGSTVGWHGSLVTVIATAIAIPAGLVAGRLVWRRTALGAHVGDALWNAGPAVALVACVALAVGAIVSLTVAWVAARVTPASLRSE